jgi:alanine racemase
LLFGSAMPFEVAKIVEQNIIPTISTVEEARLFHEEAMRQDKTVTVQVEVDTGMGRVGFWHEDAPAHFAAFREYRRLHVDGLYTHFPSADENLKETERELGLFLETARHIHAAGSRTGLLHAANSAAVLSLPAAHLDMVRPGLLLYGISPTDKLESEFTPILTFKTRVAFVKAVEPGRTISYGQTFVANRKMKVATLAVGYGDGFSRHLSNHAEVLVDGKRCPVVGRVTMDQIMVDVTGLPDVKSGDEAVLIGRQGDTEITALEMAEWAGTIPWEVLCGITKSARVPRVYLGASAA